MKRYCACAFVLSLLFATTACDIGVLDYPDPNSIGIETYFKSPEEIEAGTIGIYSSFYHDAIFTWKYPELFDGLSCEVDARPASAGEGDMQAVIRYQHNNTTVVFTQYWRMLYRMILRSNLVIDKATRYLEKDPDNSVVNRAIGDAYFLRGWAYCQLAFYWGSVPLRVVFDFEGKGASPRVPVDLIWNQGEQDLKNAQKLLPATWPGEFTGRATSGAATGFLGKLLLYRNRYAEAEVEFSKMEGRYSLLPLAQWDDNFGEDNENNQESVFEIQSADTPATNPFAGMFGDPEEAGNPGRQNGHAQLYSWNDWANWAFQPRRVNDFVYADESGNAYQDPRAALTFYGGIGDNTWCDKCEGGPREFDFDKYGYWYRKSTNKEFKPKEDGVQSENNVRLMRYADVLLMRAECQILMGNSQAGIDFINQVRSRIGAFVYTKTYSNTAALELLKRERQLELMGEQSRFNDLKRWGILKEVINIELDALFVGSSVLDRHYFFPVPQLEIDTNNAFGSVEDDWN